MENPPDISDYLDTVVDYYPDPYRVSPSIVFMTPDGEWTDNAPAELREWAERVLFPWAGQKSLMVAIVTPEGKKMAPHIDCSPKTFDMWQHKFRYVFRGNVEDLRYFDGDEYVIPTGCEKPYIIDGSWPHDMVNTYPGTKYTLCFGHPWNPQGEDDYVAKLQESYEQYKDYYISSEHMTLPENYKDMFNKERYGEE